MRRMILPLLLTMLAACSFGPRHPAAPAPAALAFTHVDVVDIETGLLLEARTVVITGNRITAVAPSNGSRVPAGAHMVDGTGKYLVPGLVDMHVHLFNNISRRPPNTWAFPLFVANGVTGVREMWTEPASMPRVEEWRRQVSADELLAPRVLAAGALVDGPGGWYPNMVEVRTPAEGQRFVREAAQAGLDFIKVYALLAPDGYHAILAEARQVGLPVAGHIPLRIPALEAARAGQSTNEHLYQIREACSTVEEQILEERLRFYARPYTEAEENTLLDAQVHRVADAFDEPTCRTVARALAESGQRQVPTLVNERRWFLGIAPERLNDARLESIPADTRAIWTRRLEDGSVTYSGDTVSLRRGWEATLRVMQLLGDAGIGFMVGTDFGQPFIHPGSTVHDEMEALVEAGLTPLQALQAATINPARYLAATDSLGTVAPGRLADLLLLDANPLEDIRNTRAIRAVVLNGRYLDREALDELGPFSAPVTRIDPLPRTDP